MLNGTVVFSEWRTFEHATPILAFAWSPTEPLLAVSSEDGNITIWNVESGKQLACFSHRIGLKAIAAIDLAWSPDGVVLASVARDRPFVSLWNALTGSVIKLHRVTASVLDAVIRNTLEGTGYVGRLFWTRDGHQLVCYNSGVLSILHAQSGQGEERTTSFKTDVLAWNQDREILAIKMGPSSVRLWSLSEGLLDKEINLDPFAEEEKSGGGIDFWTALSRSIDEMRGESKKICGLCWSRYGQVLAIACDNKCIIWDSESGSVLHEISVVERASFPRISVVRDIEFSPGDSFLGAAVIAGKWPRRRVKLSEHLLRCGTWEEVQSFSSGDLDAFKVGYAESEELPHLIRAHQGSPALAALSGNGQKITILRYDLNLLAEQGVGAKRPRDSFDIFMCYNQADRARVVKIAEELRGRGVHPWLDLWEARPGTMWQEDLEKQIGGVRASAVFIGKEGIGPWQNLEQHALLREFVKRRCAVIPVILPGVKGWPKLPLFLAGMTWVDFRKKVPDPVDQLIWGIQGERIV